MIPARPGVPYPVLSLMPVPGDVDVVVGAELMEAGRAIQRGLVTPDRTTLIASSHRSFAVQEKLVPGDGISDSAKVYDAAEAAAKRFVAFDMADLAEGTGSAISAVLFGALAGSGALPFARVAYEATIRAAGIGIELSLRAFAAGFDRTVRCGVVPPPVPPKPASAGKLYPAPRRSGAASMHCCRRPRDIPRPLHGTIAAGLRKVADFRTVMRISRSRWWVFCGWSAAAIRR
jgi:indolepyruvate ferredoxin oxidoreductase beta subunit